MGIVAEIFSCLHSLGQGAATVWSFLAAHLGRLVSAFQPTDQVADDARAAAVALLQQGGADAAGASPAWWVWLTVIAVIFLIIAIMFMILLGNRARNRSSEDEIADPLFGDEFGDQYEVRDDDELVINTADEGLAEVVIEGEDDDPEPLQRPASLFSDEPEMTVVSNDEETNDAEETPESEAEDVAEDEPTSQDTTQSENIYAFTPPSSGENETAEEEPEEEAVTEDSEPDNVQHATAFAATSRNGGGEEESKVRYAASAFKPSSISFSDIQDDEPEKPDTTPGPENADQTNRPYMTWYAREDMERAEQRQHERLDRLEQHISSLRSEQTSRLDLVISALDKKLDRIAQSSGAAKPAMQDSPTVNDMSQRLASLSGTVETQTQRLRAITQILDDRLGTVSHVYNEVRAVTERLDKLTDNINKLENNIADRASHDVMADVQLSDVVRSSLPPDTYEFKHLLPNNHRADCLVRLPHPPGAIVIDTRFPLDAFNALPSQEAVAKNLPQAKAAEDAFRRAALRHIIDVAERFIIPGETADSALLFLPTEAIYTTLHSRFPDVVRDSFRARIWIVSPATLMGTLQTLRGVLRDSRQREKDDRAREEAKAVQTEMEALRARASMLAQNFEATQAELKSLLEATTRVQSGGMSVPAPSDEVKDDGKPHDFLREQLYSGTPSWQEEDDDGSYPGDAPSLFQDTKPPSDNLR